MATQPNPRKFSEKIALHHQKQAEETAAFNAIMNDVQNSKTAQNLKQMHRIEAVQQNMAFRAGSLPNVNQMAYNNSIDLKSALNGLKDVQSPKCNNTRQSLVDKIHSNRAAKNLANAHGHHRRQVGPTIRNDVSPYSSPYLSPPSDTNWRRTNSDSAIPNVVSICHTSTSNTNSAPCAVPSFFQSNQHASSTAMYQQSADVPGINIISDGIDSGVHIPVSNSTGSLPDLTNLHIPSPLSTPIDQDVNNPSEMIYASSVPTSSSVRMMHQQMNINSNRKSPALSIPNVQAPTTRDQLKKMLVTKSASNHLPVPQKNYLSHRLSSREASPVDAGNYRTNQDTGYSNSPTSPLSPSQSPVTHTNYFQQDQGQLAPPLEISQQDADLLSSQIIMLMQQGYNNDDGNMYDYNQENITNFNYQFQQSQQYQQAPINTGYFYSSSSPTKSSSPNRTPLSPADTFSFQHSNSPTITTTCTTTGLPNIVLNDSEEFPDNFQINNFDLLSADLDPVDIQDLDILNSSNPLIPNEQTEKDLRSSSGI